MQIKQLFKFHNQVSEAVIKGNFGKKTGVERDVGIEVPPGYDRFEIDHKQGAKSATILGIKGDKATRLSTGPIELIKVLVRAYNNGGKTDADIQPLTMTQAFGSSGLNVLVDLGVKLAEKPTWSDFESNGIFAKAPYIISEPVLKKIEKKLALKTYTSKELFGVDGRPKSMLSNADLPDEETFIVDFGNGDRWLVDTGGARSYIRSWAKIS